MKETFSGIHETQPHKIEDNVKRVIDLEYEKCSESE